MKFPGLSEKSINKDSEPEARPISPDRHGWGYSMGKTVIFADDKTVKIGRWLARGEGIGDKWKGKEIPSLPKEFDALAWLP